MSIPLTRLTTGVGTVGAMFVGSPLWAEGDAPERLSAAPTVSGIFWTVVVPLLLLLVSFLSAYALYRHFSSK